MSHAATNGLHTYYRDLRRLERVDPETERELLHRVAAGDEDAMRDLVSANLAFVIKVAREYRNLGLDLEDLINEGNIGLIEAATRFDPERENKFITYAVWWIRRSILNAIHHKSSTVRLPVSQWRRMREERRIERENRINGPTEPVVQRRAPRKMEQSAPESSLPSLTRLSLDDSMSGEGRAPALSEILVDDAADLELELDTKRRTQEMTALLTRLTDRERLILKRRYGLDGEKPWTLEEIGKELGCTREWVRQIEIKTRRKLREWLEEAAAPLTPQLASAG